MYIEQAAKAVQDYIKAYNVDPTESFTIFINMLIALDEDACGHFDEGQVDEWLHFNIKYNKEDENE